MAKPFIDFWNTVRNISCDKDEMIFYRGVADCSYGFSVGTIFQKDVDEDVAYHEMLLEFPEEFSQRNHLSTLSKMQHYGLVTRLMDLTTNPLTALFFACEQDKKGADGMVSAFKVKKKDVLLPDSDKALMLACLPKFSKDDQNEIRKFCENHNGVITDQDIQFSNVMKRFLHEIRGEYPAFETAIVAQDLLNCYFVRTNKDNERIKTQDGVFVIFGLDTDGNTRHLEGLEECRYIVNNENKIELLEDLKFVGINTSTIYPGMERTALYLRGQKLGWKGISE